MFLVMEPQHKRRARGEHTKRFRAKQLVRLQIQGITLHTTVRILRIIATAGPTNQSPANRRVLMQIPDIMWLAMA
jgi:hypothetical protein